MLVIKRDQTSENFDPNKLVRVANAAGLTIDEAKNVAEEVENLLQGQKVNQIPSATIRDLMYKELLKVNKYAANLYKWYEKVKNETNDSNTPG